MSVRNIVGSNAQSRRLSAAVPTPVVTPWVRNPSWLPLTAVGDTEQAFRGLISIFPDSAFVAFTAAGAYTVDWGDGTTNNYTSGATALKQYDYADTDLDGSDAPVTLTDTGDLVERTAHGYTDGMEVRFYNIVTTTGISAGQIYYVINATTDNFQITSEVGGSAIALTSNGTATLLPYKQAIVTVTPQAGQNLTALNLNIKHTQTNLQAYDRGWLDIEVGSPNFTSAGLIISTDSTTLNTQFNMCERVAIRNFGNITDMSYRFRTMRKLREVWFASTAAVITMLGMFSVCSSLTTVPLFNTAAVTGMVGMFQQCTSLTTVPLFNTAAVINMTTMFSGCSSLTTVPLFNTAAVTNMAQMFQGCSSLTTVPLFNTAAVTNMSSMFSGCSSLTTVPLFNTAAVTNMSSMFSTCPSLTTVPLFNTAAVTSMASMFISCSSLTTVPLFNTAAVTNMSSMFSTCPSLTTVPLFNTAVVTNMSTMFSSSTSLTTVPLFNTAVVTNMTSMFFNCPSLTTVPLFNTAAVTNMTTMFSSSTSLTTVPLFNTAAVTNMTSMFNGCSSLAQVPALVTTAVTSSGNFATIFNNCPSLTRIEAKNFRFSFSVANCKLSATALNEIYTNLPTVTAQTITVTGNWGTAADDPTIATAKGWTVTG